MSRAVRHSVGLLVITSLCCAPAIAEKSPLTPPKNKYAPSDDVKLGQQAAQQVEEQMPILNNAEITAYVRTIGDRLVRAVPSTLQHPEFEYTFKVVDVKDINAFALPGGPMFVNRGMLAAAQTEGEVAGVMAHELSHVVLRHGTAQATAATKYEVGQVAGAILGAIIGGRTGAVVARGSELGVGLSFLRFSRDYEKQADLLGARIMANAGYDPVDMANMFKTIEQQAGNGGPEFLSDHPNPGNRIEYITAEARTLEVANPVRNTARFNQMQADLRKLPPPRDMRNASNNPASGGSVGRVEPPASSYRTYTEGNLFRVSVPGNWNELPSGQNAVWFAPQGAYGSLNGQTVFTHGVQFGVEQVNTSDLEDATRALVQSLAQGNPNIRQSGAVQAAPFADRSGMLVRLQNVSEATGRPEVVTIRTTLLDQNTLFYAISVAPQADYDEYAPVFSRVAESVALNR